MEKSGGMDKVRGTRHSRIVEERLAIGYTVREKSGGMDKGIGTRNSRKNKRKDNSIGDGR